MLISLSVKNYVLIQDLKIDFDQGLNIITGETGAGKSILLGALQLILGTRADTKVLFNQEKKCIIEGHFNISQKQFKRFFEEHELDFDTPTILRREISAQGKSRAFINDTPVTLDILRSLSEQLVDIHSQHASLELHNSSFQLGIIDAIAKHDQLLHSYRQDYKEWKQLQLALEALQQQELDSRKEQDYQQFLFKELEDAALQAGEQELLEQELDTLAHAEDIQEVASACATQLNESDYAITTQINELKSKLHTIAGYHQQVPPIIERLNSNLIDLKDVADELSSLAMATPADGERLDTVNERLQLIHSLQKKHNCQSIEALLDVQQQLDEALQNLDSLSDTIEQKKQAIAKLETKLWDQGTQLSKQRAKQTPLLEKQIQVLLGDVNMPHARIKVAHQTLNKDQMTANGIDAIEFLFSSNKGSDFTSLKKVSGGESSRLMLCIKSVIAQYSNLPTIIFDEIDTGISGEVALKVGEIMKSLGKKHQVMSITHLPQIASKGHSHYMVYKETTEKATITGMKKLQAEERTIEIARMLGGLNPSASAIANARELIEA